MIGTYDFCGHYEWTFAWLEQMGGKELVESYWDKAISEDSQRHARDLIESKGFAGMLEYWSHTLEEEGAGYVMVSDESHVRCDMYQCPSKGFLIKNNLKQHEDYCDHCIGWIGPVMRDAGFVIDHEHNHQGQCWWEFTKLGAATPPMDAGKIKKDIRKAPNWESGEMDVFHHVIDDFKKTRKPSA